MRVWSRYLTPTLALKRFQPTKMNVSHSHTIRVEKDARITDMLRSNTKEAKMK